MYGMFGFDDGAAGRGGTASLSLSVFFVSHPQILKYMRGTSIRIDSTDAIDMVGRSPAPPLQLAPNPQSQQPTPAVGLMRAPVCEAVTSQSPPPKADSFGSRTRFMGRRPLNPSLGAANHRLKIKWCPIIDIDTSLAATGKHLSYQVEGRYPTTA